MGPLFLTVFCNYLAGASNLLLLQLLNGYWRNWTSTVIQAGDGHSANARVSDRKARRMILSSRWVWLALRMGKTPVRDAVGVLSTIGAQCEARCIYNIPCRPPHIYCQMPCVILDIP